MNPKAAIASANYVTHMEMLGTFTKSEVASAREDFEAGYAAAAREDRKWLLLQLQDTLKIAKNYNEIHSESALRFVLCALGGSDV